MDTYQFEQEEDLTFQDDSEESLLEDLEDEFTSEFLQDILREEDRMEFLNTNDYNLNSPIILEHVIELGNYIQGKFYKKVFWKDSWDIIKWIVTNQKIQLDIELWNISYFHTKIFTMLLSPSKLNKSTFFDKILNPSIAYHDKNLDFLNIFLKKWGNGQQVSSTILHSRLDKMNNPFFIWWSEIYYRTHIAVLHMNCSGGKEALSLTRLYGSKVLKDNGRNIGFLINCPIFGVLIVHKDYMICQNLKSIWDRPFLLMIKDITMSRTQSILSMIHSIDPVYRDDQIESLIKLYHIGDKFLYKTGNVGYDGLKLLEPICNLQLCNLARTYRDKIPEFPEFRQHVENSIQEKSFGHDELTEIFHLVLSETNLDMILNYYSVFRHWGHPNIEYLEGLEKLHDQVNMDKIIDDDYAQALASDLAFKILKKEYFEKKKWFVDLTKMDQKNLMFNHIKNSTWPNQFEIEDFGDNWHKLPITKIFDIPDLIDPSLIYSDKSHSMNREEVVNHVLKFPDKPIPTCRVLQTVLSKPATDWKSFLQRVNDKGLDLNSLIIGLKAKEREMKRIGRFFSLMSWELREYFVFTEYLIKEHFVPLFHGLTMADDLQSVIKKMLDNSQGQGRSDYQFISIANHIDYEKWNNHQRKESNVHVFRVMGQCFGLSELFVRTHEFFGKSLIYYPQRPDLMYAINNTLENNSSVRVCWNGQKGGLEGLRQKGWSVVNYLVIERESKIRNTKVKVLAQGDNQTISTFYQLQSYFDDNELNQHIQSICKNNKAIMEAIEAGTSKLGLIINKDETMVSADYLNYGKVPIFRGIIQGLHLKRWSRVNCTTNDQVPSLNTSLSSCTTNSLTVSHYSADPINAIYLHSLFGNIIITLLLEYNPSLRTSPRNIVLDREILDTSEFRILLLYLDPSLGGVSGTSLTRFMIRMFPDPITESLSFWKFMYNHTNNEIWKNMFAVIGNPSLMEFSIEHLDKLIESPTSINLVRGISATNLIKNEVKKNLINGVSYVSNQIIKHALEYTRDEEKSILQWARTIKPLFPRFLSEMVNSTYYGITSSLIGLFQNSKTIRGQFKKKYHKRIDDVIFKSEIIGISSLIKILHNTTKFPSKIWKCSSTQADLLREKSWGDKILGMTIPHPFEMLSLPDNSSNMCQSCKTGSGYKKDYIMVMIPKGFHLSNHQKGPYPPYLGSKTSETTSIIQPWEKETNIPVIKRAAKLRQAISWFIKPESNLAKSIMGNLFSLTGEEWGEGLTGFKRTGSALHRYSCARVSNGGFCASSPSKFMWMICTTDTMTELTGKNYDFMFQSLLIYSQATAAVYWGMSEEPVNLHFHINCEDCIREIEEPFLESDWVLQLPNVSHILSAWRPDPSASWGETKIKIDLPKKDWDKLSPEIKTYHVGFIMGFIFSDMLLSNSKHVSDSSLFPLGISRKIHPRSWFNGIIMGIQKASALHIVHRRNLLEMQKPKIVQWGSSYFCIEKLCESPGFLGMVRDGPLFSEITNIPHKIPPSYPLNNYDLGLMARNYLKTRLLTYFDDPKSIQDLQDIWTFSDLQSHDILGSLGLAALSFNLIMNIKKSKNFKENVRIIQQSYINIKNNDWSGVNQAKALKHIGICDQEVRHACKFDIGPSVVSIDKNLQWGDEFVGQINMFSLPTTHEPNKEYQIIPTPRRFCPLISGLRTFQMATGSHYKMRSILKNMGIKWNFGLVCGDGSGGISSYLCRSNPFGEVVFNSLLEMEGIDFKGSHPSPPPAINAIGKYKDNCINLHDCWSAPNDLTFGNTWDYLGSFTAKKMKKFDLIIMEADVPNLNNLDKIRKYLSGFIKTHLCSSGTVIVRSFIDQLIKKEDKIIEYLISTFRDVNIIQTNLSSSYTYEVYIVFQRMDSSIPSNRYIDYQGLAKIIEHTYAYSNNESEFKRAIQLAHSNLIIGVPKELIINPYVEMTSILSKVGLESGYSVSISKSWIRHINDNACNYVISVIILVAETFIKTTRVSHSKQSPPSNHELENMLAFYVGSYLWITLNTGDIGTYSFLVDKLSNHFDVYIKYGIISTGKDLKYSIKWGFNMSKTKDYVLKRIRLHRYSSLIGSVIRCWQRMSICLPMLDHTYG
ncbi:polymerase [Bangoran virus]|nr:polymerase [Bangoran virus]UAX43327.1 polymerase [Bangoran virus]